MILVTCLNPLISHTKKLTLRGDTNLPSGHRVDGQTGFHQGCLISKPMSLTTSLPCLSWAQFSLLQEKSVPYESQVPRLCSSLDNQHFQGSIIAQLRNVGYNEAFFWKKKKISSKLWKLMDKAPGHPKALMEMYKVNVVFMPTNTTLILSVHRSRNSFKIQVLLFKKSIL